jgi:hypothetical protein
MLSIVVEKPLLMQHGNDIMMLNHEFAYNMASIGLVKERCILVPEHE